MAWHFSAIFSQPDRLEGSIAACFEGAPALDAEALRTPVSDLARDSCSHLCCDAESCALAPEVAWDYVYYMDGAVHFTVELAARLSLDIALSGVSHLVIGSCGHCISFSSL